MVEVQTNPGQRLDRRTMRNGSPLPEVATNALEAMPQPHRGAASAEGIGLAERRNLFARCGGKAALLALSLLLFSATVFGQTPSPTPSATPAVSPQELQVPEIAPEFRPAQKPLPELSRVGVEMER